VAGIVATAETDIIASPARVWSALTDPAQIKRYMFGSEVETDWKPGGTSREAMKKRWSPSRTSVTVMCITTQRRNQPYAG
jgi:uncharacterized protein YndB with AHSA1/START domain